LLVATLHGHDDAKRGGFLQYCFCFLHHRRITVSKFRHLQYKQARRWSILKVFSSWGQASRYIHASCPPDCIPNQFKVTRSNEKIHVYVLEPTRQGRQKGVRW